MSQGTIQHRDAFLANLYQRLGSKPMNVEEHPILPVNDLPHETLANLSPEEVLGVAKARVKKINAEIVETSLSTLRESIASLIKEQGGGDVLFSSDERFQQYGLTDVTGNFTSHFWLPGKENRDNNIQTARNANISVAFAEFLIAETGSVVVETSAAQGRTLHFLPAHYISIVPMSKVVPRTTQMADFYQEKIEKGEKVGSDITIISGPSNSGDIEMELVVGLHGPLQVTYVVVKDR